MAEPVIKYTKYEEARMIGSRALQISMGAPYLVKLSDEELAKIGFDAIKIAKMEFAKGIIPITVRRFMPEKPVA